MTYDPRTGMTTERDREVIVTPSGSSGGTIIATVLVVLAVLFAIWLFGFNGNAPATNDNPTLTTAPVVTAALVVTTAPVETTVVP